MMSTIGRSLWSDRRSEVNGVLSVWGRALSLKKETLPPVINPSAPKRGEAKVSQFVVLVFVTSLAPWISSLRTTKTPLSFASGDAATFAAFRRFMGPSAEIEVAGLIEPTRTTGFSLFNT